MSIKEFAERTQTVIKNITISDNISRFTDEIQSFRMNKLKSLSTIQRENQTLTKLEILSKPSMQIDKLTLDK